ncbi:MAG: helix-turn-helix domain-containing protein [Treponema sp.]|jgi:excisionase family DNA binding protein|nr:helix-turn-helix domain-containing protein [Treponema sp.]
MKDGEYLTYKDFADKIGVHKQTIYRWVKSGILRHIRFSSRIVLIPDTELDRLLVEPAQADKKPD